MHNTNICVYKIASAGLRQLSPVQYFTANSPRLLRGASSSKPTEYKTQVHTSHKPIMFQTTYLP